MRQAGALEFCLDQPQRFGRGVVERPYRPQNTLPLVGLSLLEAYLENRLWIALQYRASFSDIDELTALVLIRYHECDASDVSDCFRPGGIRNIEPVDSHFRLCRDENDVLIDNIETMEAVKSELPAFVRLYFIEDGIENGLTWSTSLLFMSIDGTFKRLPVLMEGECPAIKPSRFVGVCRDMVSVIECGPKIMDGIAKHGAGVFREGGGIFQRATIFLSPHSLHVASDVVPEEGFELIDVMFGPFGF